MKRLAAAIALLAGSCLPVLHAQPSAACSCVSPRPTVADLVGESDVAFAGRVVRQDRVELPGVDWINLVSFVEVEQAAKGVESGEIVVVYGSDQETSCGTMVLPVVGTVVLALKAHSGRFEGGGTGFCQPNLSVSDIMSVPDLLPSTAPGPVSLVVAGRLGPAQLVALDLAGQPVAYGFAVKPRGTIMSVASCPGSRRVISIESDGAYSLLVVRSLPNLDIEQSHVLSAPDVLAVKRGVLQYGNTTCLNAAGTNLVMTQPGAGTADSPGFALVFDGHFADPVAITPGTGTEVVVDASAGTITGFGPRNIVTWSLSTGAELQRIELTGIPNGHEAISLAQSPYGGWWVVLSSGREEYGDHTVVALAHVQSSGEQRSWALASIPNEERVVTATVKADRLWLATGNVATSVALPDLLSDDVIDLAGAVWDLGYDWPHGGGSTWLTVDPEHGQGIMTPIGWRVAPVHPMSGVRVAAFVPDGPVADPSAIVRSVPEKPYVSDQILTREEFERRFAAGPTTTQDNDQSATTSTAESAPSNRDDNNQTTIFLLVAAGALAVAVALGSTLRWRRRLARVDHAES